MQRPINTSAGLFARVFSPPGPVVELGSYYPPEWGWLCNLRPYFPGREYMGCDLRIGHGVDKIEDAQQLSFGDSSIGTVLMFELLEHLPRPQEAISEAYRVLRDDGLLALSTPFDYRLHAFPDDYWRFTASGINTLLGVFADKVIFSLGPRVKPAFVFAVAAKRSSADFTESKARFRREIEAEFRRSRLQGHVSVLKRTARELAGQLLGRAHVEAVFFDPAAAGGYFDLSPETPARNLDLVAAGSRPEGR